jgi:hypothetical protein
MKMKGEVHTSDILQVQCSHMAVENTSVHTPRLSNLQSGLQDPDCHSHGYLPDSNAKVNPNKVSI